jgi:hypothetical protein
MAKLLNLLDPENINCDYIGFTYPNTTTEVATYRRTNATGPIVMVITVVYTDATKTAISSIVRAPVRS